MSAKTAHLNGINGDVKYLLRPVAAMSHVEPEKQWLNILCVPSTPVWQIPGRGLARSPMNSVRTRMQKITRDLPPVQIKLPEQPTRIPAFRGIPQRQPRQIARQMRAEACLSIAAPTMCNALNTALRRASSAASVWAGLRARVAGINNGSDTGVRQARGQSGTRNMSSGR